MKIPFRRKPTVWLEATPEEVWAAQIEVQAFRTAGLTPDPMVVRIAEAVSRKKPPSEETP